MTHVKKILYVGQIRIGQTCYDRMIALKELGHETLGFDTTHYLTAGPRLARSIAHRYNVGSRVYEMNDAIATLETNGFRPDLIWIDKGTWILPETIEKLKNRFSVQIIHFTPDTQLLAHKSRHFLASIPLYDVAITTKNHEVSEYWKLGAKRLILTGQSYDERRVSDAAGRPDLESDVCFIGGCENHYRHLIDYVARMDVDLKVWGERWGRSRKYIQGSGLWGADYFAGIKSARVSLGLLREASYDTSTTRSFEIPASGTMLLGERTDEHRCFFEEGKEAEFFGSPEEMREKICFYVENEKERKRIVGNGVRRCKESGYDNRTRLRRMIAWVSAADEEFVDQRFGSGL